MSRKREILEHIRKHSAWPSWALSAEVAGLSSLVETGNGCFGSYNYLNEAGLKTLAHEANDDGDSDAADEILQTLDDESDTSDDITDDWDDEDENHD